MRIYLIHFFRAVWVILIPCLIFAWWAEPLYGDLTRVGKWTERDFGPNAAHPIIHVKANGRFLANPDIMVLGDSFSEKNLWQSVLSDQMGYTVKTFGRRRNCTANWIDAALAEPASKIIVIETVERELVEAFSRISLCPHTEPRPYEVAEGVTAGRRPRWPPTISLSYLVPTALNTARSNISPDQYSKRFGVINAPLLGGCASFSSRHRDRLLYLANDELKQGWTAKNIRNTVSNIVKIQEKVEANGKKFVFIVAPDKLSAYQNCIRFKTATKVIPNINQLLITAGVHAPDMQKIFSESILNLVDLYDPDNTHWSEAGYILAGNEITKYLSEIPSVQFGQGF